jgi:hypothetical protein
MDDASWAPRPALPQQSHCRRRAPRRPSSVEVKKRRRTYRNWRMGMGVAAVAGSRPPCKSPSSSSSPSSLLPCASCCPLRSLFAVYAPLASLSYVLRWDHRRLDLSLDLYLAASLILMGIDLYLNSKQNRCGFAFSPPTMRYTGPIHEFWFAATCLKCNPKRRTLKVRERAIVTCWSIGY